MAIVQLRHQTDGRAYFDKRIAEGKTSREAIRALKRHLSDTIYRQMTLDAQQARTSPGGHSGNDSDSSVTGSHPNAGSSDKPLPGPVTTKPRTRLPAAS
jgi:hypothetical protein